MIHEIANAQDITAMSKPATKNLHAGEARIVTPLFVSIHVSSKNHVFLWTNPHWSAEPNAPVRISHFSLEGNPLFF